MDILSLINIMGDLEIQVNLKTKISNRTLENSLKICLGLFEFSPLFARIITGVFSVQK